MAQSDCGLLATAPTTTGDGSFVGPGPLPPGQRLAKGWPVAHYGPVPRFPHGAKLIHQESAAELDYPDALQPIVDLATALDLLNDQHPDQQHIRDQVTSAARDFLATEAHQTTALELHRTAYRDRFTESEPEPE